MKLQREKENIYGKADCADILFIRKENGKYGHVGIIK
jgi:hypothetical protein